MNQPESWIRAADTRQQPHLWARDSSNLPCRGMSSFLPARVFSNSEILMMLTLLLKTLYTPLPTTTWDQAQESWPGLPLRCGKTTGVSQSTRKRSLTAPPKAKSAPSDTLSMCASKSPKQSCGCFWKGPSCHSISLKAALSSIRDTAKPDGWVGPPSHSL